MRASHPVCALFSSLVFAASAHAAPDDPPVLTVVDRGAAVELTATGLTAASLAVSTVRERIEVPLDGHPDARTLSITDPTIKRAEVRGEPRVLSIKLRRDRAVVRALSPHVRVHQDGDVLLVTIPREVPAETLAPPAPPADLAGPAGTPAEVAPPSAGLAAPEGALPDPAPAPSRAADGPVGALDTSAPPSAATSAPPAPPHPPSARPAAESAGDLTNGALLAGLGGAGLLAAAWLRRRRRSAAPVATIDVVAQRSLGGKARVVWLAAGGREMVLAVTPQQVRMLGQWRRPGEDPTGALSGALSGDGPASLPRATTISPTVTGILRLRQAAPRDPAAEPAAGLDEADADTIWAREIIAATGGRR